MMLLLIISHSGMINIYNGRKLSVVGGNWIKAYFVLS